MDNNILDRSTPIGSYQQPDEASIRAFMSNVFIWMFGALAVSAVFALLFAMNASLLGYLIDLETGKLNLLGYITMFAPLGFVFLMSLGFQRLSYPALLATFMAYAAVTGISLSFIFLRFELTSIYVVFGIAAAMFGTMAVVGYTTKTDLTKFGSIMIMGLIGIVIASVVNMFLQNDGFAYIISFVGVAVFTGLTAYDVQKLKNIAAQAAGQDTRKMAILGALSLYLDFINLFLMLLNLFGRRK